MNRPQMVPSSVDAVLITRDKSLSWGQRSKGDTLVGTTAGLLRAPNSSRPGNKQRAKVNHRARVNHRPPEDLVDDPLLRLLRFPSFPRRLLHSRSVDVAGHRSRRAAGSARALPRALRRRFRRYLIRRSRHRLPAGAEGERPFETFAGLWSSVVMFCRNHEPPQPERTAGGRLVLARLSVECGA